MRRLIGNRRPRLNWLREEDENSKLFQRIESGRSIRVQ